MSRIPIFYAAPTDEVALKLRRYRDSSTHKCAATGSYCNGEVGFGRAPARLGKSGAREILLCPEGKPADSDPRWPTKCDRCGEAFGPSDPYQLFHDRIYRAADGREWPLRELPTGAVYNASWYADMGWVGPDGRSLVVILPTPDRHPWCIDSRASNCTMKNDSVHRCWVRHGRPEDGTLHVDKNGHTCAAGAGSIGVPGYHGFLHHGALVG